MKRRCEEPREEEREWPLELYVTVLMKEFPGGGRIDRWRDYRRLIDLMTVNKRIGQQLVREGVCFISADILKLMPREIFERFSSLVEVDLPLIFEHRANHLLKLPHLDTLNMYLNRDIDETIIENLTQVKSLTTPHLSTSGQQYAYLEKLTQLTSLRTKAPTLDDDFLKRHTSLTSLCWYPDYRLNMKYTEMTNCGLSLLKNLERLELDNQRFSPSICLSDCLPKLSHLLICAGSCSEENMSNLTTLTSLTTITTWWSFRSLPSMLNLKSLTINGLPPQLTHYKVRDKISLLTNLESLTLVHSDMHGESLAPLHSLKNLGISHVSSLHLLDKHLTHLSQLHKLTMTHCTGFNGSCLASFPFLTSLGIVHCPLSGQYMSHKLTSIRELMLDGVNGVGLESLETLEGLDLRLVRGVDDSQFTRLTRLTSLTLVRQNDLTTRIFDSLSSLTCLYAFECRQIPSSFLPLSCKNAK